VSRRGAFRVLCTKKAPRVALCLALGLAIGAAPALAETPQTSVNDVEDEVMCPICGTLLELAESPQAERERALVERLIDEGKSKAEVKDALVAQYGPGVLALPEGRGFDLSAYLVPAVAFVAAAVALALGVRRWRRAAPPSRPTGASAHVPHGEDARRLEEDLTRYDL
jgi:cytochrome c-type biogenesis protein CcmH